MLSFLLAICWWHDKKKEKAPSSFVVPMRRQQHGKRRHKRCPKKDREAAHKHTSLRSPLAKPVHHLPPPPSRTTRRLIQAISASFLRRRSSAAATHVRTRRLKRGSQIIVEPQRHQQQLPPSLPLHPLPCCPYSSLAWPA